MDSKYQALFTPWKIRDVEIKNRIVLCPMGGTSLFGWMEPNHFDKEAANFFLERAKNNVGLIIPGIAPIRDTIGGRWLYQNKKMFRDTGAKLFVQITAGMGRSWGISDEVVHLHKNPVLRVLAKPILDTNYQMASPSVLPSRWAEDITCPEMTLKQIEEIIEAFGKTAALCKEAGVDGVEVHAVHEGYLLDQFAMKYTNHRKDAYGGSFENDCEEHQEGLRQRLPGVLAVQRYLQGKGFLLWCPAGRKLSGNRQRHGGKRKGRKVLAGCRLRYAQR